MSATASSAERRWNQRRYQIEESCTQNNNARTVFIEHMTPGTSVPIHQHGHFSEKFAPLSGSLSVYVSGVAHTSEDKWLDGANLRTLGPGEIAVIKQGDYHKYFAGPEKAGTALRVILEPGWPKFEKLLMVMNGLAEDGELQKMGNSAELLALAMELSDAKVIGPAKAVVDKVHAEKRQEYAALKQRLLKKYDTKENLAKLMVNSQSSASK